ncbi:acetyl-CoA hydrolase/transferase family protein [Roseibium algae]|uniref:Acetyl-CoA hydrolase/transferase C-terminal domain-containing protein n=1 Tax=Roseibium algae TaxID=3123038 RepID=A0ABU8TGL8_9HYPH
MMKRQANAPMKRISAEEAAGLVRPGMWLDYGAIFGQPDVFDAALAKRKSELSNVGFRSCLSVKPRAVLEADPEGEVFHWVNLHFSGYDRKMHDAGRANYMPVNLGEIPDYYRRFIEPIDILVVKARPMDADGNFNLSAATLWLRAMIERARMVIIEETTGIPHVLGDGVSIHKDEVDYVIAGDNAAAPELPNPAPSEVDKAVARLIIDEIEDGSCLQIGIGGMPNAVCSLLQDSTAEDLGIHTEMLTDGIIDLYRAGRITGARKQINPGKMVCTFALGSTYLYDAIDHNPDVEFHAVDYTNLPQNIMQNDKVVAINNTTQMDLGGQAASETDGHRHLTGTGGQAQFARGAYASKGGKSFICLSSTFERRGERRSRIVLGLTPGNAVTTTRADMMYVVTEYGITNLKGKSMAERAKALIALAHPDYREGLERDAYDNGLIPRGYFGATVKPS